MKKLPFFLLLAFILGGCRTAHSVSQSFLSSIDSMMTDNPDTAYKVLKDISPDELNTRRERAYYALLLTQARHKNYIPLRNDSLINVAVNYYKGQRDREKYAKALLYKGICIEEMNDPQKAIEVYAEAEKVALSTTDYLTTGLINSQMAWLYQDMYIENKADIERFKKAMEYFRLAGHKKNE
ncbi:MAG TPA: hypothetical protein PKK16_07185, partial [Bacteroidales bacterium]|nr:hypothetical protein [Bacteroidales bacterium]